MIWKFKYISAGPRLTDSAVGLQSHPCNLHHSRRKRQEVIQIEFKADGRISKPKGVTKCT
jgi:hypothetical protein